MANTEYLNTCQLTRRQKGSPVSSQARMLAPSTSATTTTATRSTANT